MRVLAWSDCAITGTGFGVVSKYVLTALHNTGKYDIHHLAINFHGDFVDKQVVPWQMQPAKLLDPNDPHGIKMFQRTLMKNDYDIVWILNDLYVTREIVAPLREIKRRMIAEGRKVPTFIYYYPVDCRVPEDSGGMVLEADIPVCYTSHGKEETLLTYPDVKNRLREIPHGVDTKVFHPIPLELIWQLKEQYFGVPKETTVVINVNRNSTRKQMQYSMLAFREFKKQVPTSVMYLHTAVRDQGGDLIKTIAELGMSYKSDIIFPTKYSPSSPAPAEVLNRLYNAGDIFLTTHLGEGWGLCLAPETQIDTLRGSIQIQDIEVGDQVIGRDGIYRTVLDITQRKVSSICTVKPIGSPSVRVTREHPFLVTRTEGRSCDWVKVTDLKPQDMIALVKPKERDALPEFFDLRDYISSAFEEDDNYIWKKMGFSPKTGRQVKIKKKVPLNGHFLSFIGWYLAEGSNDNGRRVELDLHADEVQIARSIQSYLAHTFDVQGIVDFNGANKCRLRASSSLFAETMSALCGNHARNKHIPECLMRSPHLLGLLIRSLFEGDGSLVHRSRSLSTASPSLAYQVRSICAANDILINVSYNEDRDIYNCIVYPGHIDRWNKFVQEDIELPPIQRKSAQHFVETDDYFFVAIRSISEQKETLDVYDICVDKSHSFTGNGILLHNTVTEAMAAGTPVVAPNNTSMPQQLGKGSQRGYMYPCKDQLWIDQSGFRKKGLIPDIVKKMMQAYNDGHKYKNPKVLAARNWTKKHDWNEVTKQWVSLFDEARSGSIPRVQTMGESLLGESL